MSVKSDMIVAPSRFEAESGVSAVDTLEAPGANPVLCWAVVGAAVLAFELYVWTRWIVSSHFAARPVDGAQIAAHTRVAMIVAQVVSPAIVLLTIVRVVVVPWRTAKRLSTDGMLLISWFFVWFQDPLCNFFSTQLYYSSGWLNLGSWTLGSFPGWVSPAGDHLPEPILVMGLGYVWLGFLGSVAACRAMRLTQARWPRASKLELAAVAWVVCIVLDAVAEIALEALGTFAWPGAIRGLTLFYGRAYQYPIYEGVLFGAVIATGGVLRYFRDDRGSTVVERGVERLPVTERTRSAVRLLAIFGAMQVAMFTLWSVPMAWLGAESHIDRRFPAHLENGMRVGSGLDVGLVDADQRGDRQRQLERG